MNKAKITYDTDRGRFLIATPFYLNSLPKSLPNRKWEPKNSYWSAPAIRKNIEHMVKKFGPSTVEFSPEARKVLDDAVLKYKSMASGRHDKHSRFPAWYKFKTTPRQKQREALDKIYGLKSIALLMDMRTGKTKIVIDFTSALRMEAKCDGVLIICPLSIRMNWLDEIKTHAPFDIDAHLLDTSKPKEYDKWLAKPHDFKWLIVGVESFAAGSAIKFAERFLMAGIKRLTCVDESHKIKTHNAERSKRIVGLRNYSEYRLIMTGTPISQGPMDFFMQFEFLDPDIIGLGDFYSYRAAYAVMGGYEDKQLIGYQNLEELIEIVEPFVYQVRKNEVFPDDPPKTYIRREVTLNAEQRRLYIQMKKEARVETEGLDGSKNKSLIVQNVLEKMLRMQEITGGIVTYQNEVPPEVLENPILFKKFDKFRRELIPGPNPKIEELLAVAEEYDGPTVVWCAYVEEIRLVVAALRKCYGDDQVVELHGSIDEAQRHHNVRVLFQGRKARFLVANAATGGVGLTMSAADVEVYYSNTFNYTDREQSEERAFAPGKPLGTAIIDLVATGTVDAHIWKSLAMKKDISEYVRGAIDDLKASIYGEIS